MKFNKGNCKDLHLERKSHRQQCMLWATQLESSLVEEGLGVLEDARLNMSCQCTLAAKKSIVILNRIRRLRCCQQAEGGDSSPLFSIGETTHEGGHTLRIVSISGLLITKETEIRERVHQIAAEMIKGLKHPFCEERLGEQELFSLENRRFRGILSTYINSWKEGVKVTETEKAWGGFSSMCINAWREGVKKDLSSYAQWQDKRQRAQTDTWDALAEHQEKTFSLWELLGTGTACSERLCSCPSLETLKSGLDMVLGKWFQVALFEQRHWTWWPLNISSRLGHSAICDSVILRLCKLTLFVVDVIQMLKTTSVSVDTLGTLNTEFPEKKY